MWALFVVSLLPQIDDAKVTRYAEYKDETSCIVEMVRLETEELGGLEYALCSKVKQVKLIKK
jgi:hypothetical protein